MLSVRLSTALDDRAGERAAIIGTAVRQHPLAAQLTGTIIIGGGGAGTLRRDDARPRVIVALADPVGGTRLAEAVIARCDALVVAERGVGRRVLEAGRGRPVIVVQRVDQLPAPFLADATDRERAEAWHAVARSPDLARAINVSATRDGLPDEATARAISDIVIEAVVAADRGYTPAMERPAG